MSFAPRSPGDVPALIARHPLAWVVSHDFDATPLPLLSETDARGTLVALFGHMSRRNPQRAAFERDPRALILFSGPDAYVSPGLVSNPTWGPTWNYAVVRIVADLVFVPKENDASIRRLSEHLEGDAWTVEQMGRRYEELKEHVVAFRASVRSCEAVFKLGQDEDDQTFAEIVAAHPDRVLAAAMTAQRPASSSSPSSNASLLR